MQYLSRPCIAVSHDFHTVPNSDDNGRIPIRHRQGITFKIMEATVARGVFTYFGGTGPVRDIINVAPPFIIDEDEMDEIVAALDEAITEVCTRAERAA